MCRAGILISDIPFLCPLLLYPDANALGPFQNKDVRLRAVTPFWAGNEPLFKKRPKMSAPESSQPIHNLEENHHGVSQQRRKEGSRGGGAEG